MTIWPNTSGVPCAARVMKPGWRIATVSVDGSPAISVIFLVASSIGWTAPRSWRTSS